MQWVKQRLLFIVGIVLLGFTVSVPVSYLNSDTALAQNPPTQTTAVEEERSCAIEKVGWLVCPFIELSSWIGDRAFSMLANMFLETEPELVANNSGTKIAWESARTLANIMFVIVFLVIIISQVTGQGINNYGIKRMLPRLIVAAIAVNVSFWICQAFVDLSNIAGWTLKDFMSQMATRVSSQSAMPTSSVNIDPTNGLSGGSLTVMAVAILATGGVVLYLLPALLSILLTIALTCTAIILILLLRKALIVLLVVLSPIAFVMYLLPNTERLFDRWLKMFGQLLMVFPVVSLLFGAGQLASSIVLVAGSQGDSGMYKSGGKCVQLPSNTSPEAKVANCGEKSTPLLLGLVAAGIAVAPLIAVWPVLQGALAATGSIGGKIQNLSNRGIEASKRRRKGDMDALSDRRALAAMNNPRGIVNIATLNSKRRKAFRDYARAGTKAELGRATENAVNERISNEKKSGNTYARQVAGGGRFGLSGTTTEAVERAKGRAEAALDKQKQEEVQNAQLSIQRQAGGQMDAIAEELKKAIESGNEVNAKAAQNLLLGMGGAGADAFINAMKGRSGGLSDVLAQNIRLNHGNVKSYSAGLNQWANSSEPGTTLDSAMKNPAAYSNLSAEQMAGQSKETLLSMKTAVSVAMDTYNDTTIEQSKRDEALGMAQNIVNSASSATKSQSFDSTKEANKEIVRDLAAGRYQNNP